MPNAAHVSNNMIMSTHVFNKIGPQPKILTPRWILLGPRFTLVNCYEFYSLLLRWTITEMGTHKRAVCYVIWWWYWDPVRHFGLRIYQGEGLAWTNDVEIDKKLKKVIIFTIENNVKLFFFFFYKLNIMKMIYSLSLITKIIFG